MAENTGRFVRKLTSSFLLPAAASSYLLSEHRAHRFKLRTDPFNSTQWCRQGFTTLRQPSHRSAGPMLTRTSSTCQARPPRTVAAQTPPCAARRCSTCTTDSRRLSLAGNHLSQESHADAHAVQCACQVRAAAAMRGSTAGLLEMSPNALEHEAGTAEEGRQSDFAWSFLHSSESKAPERRVVSALRRRLPRRARVQLAAVGALLRAYHEANLPAARHKRSKRQFVQLLHNPMMSERQCSGHPASVHMCQWSECPPATCTQRRRQPTSRDKTAKGDLG